MTTRDDFMIQTSKENVRNDYLINRKTYHTVQDNNNSSYSNNQVYFQLSNIYNLNKYYDWSNALLILPITINVKSLTAANAPGQFLNANINVALKNNLHLINSLMMSVNQKVVHQTTNNINEYLNFVKLSEVTNNTLPYYDYLNFYPEDSDALSDKYNFTFEQGTNNLTSLTNNIGTFNSFKYKTDKLKAVSDGYLTKYLKTGVQSQYIDNKIDVSDTEDNYEYMCYIKLSDISDFFKKVGVSKLFVDQLTLYMNMGSSVWTFSNPSTSLNTNCSESTNSFQYNTAPFYVNYNGGILAASAVATNKLEFKISLTNSMKKNCEIYIPGFVLDPTVETNFISNPIREFLFNDVYQTNVSSIAANSNFSIKLNNAISNALGVLIIPYVNSSHTNNKFITSSIVNVEPNLPSIGLSLKNLNCLVAGEQVLLKSADYNYEHFLSNLENGGLNTVTGGFNLETSLLNLQKWNKNYKYYYFNLNFLEKQKDVSQNVELQGLNDNNVNIYLNVFIIYQKRVELNKENGNILSINQI